MKVTPWNIMKFWKRLMFPPHRHDYYSDRLLLKSDLPWEPWLHCGVWIATSLALLFGDTKVLPPINGVDWVWVSFGLVSPPVGFFSVWALEFARGKARYMAIWTRMASDIGLVVAILSYLVARGQLGLLHLDIHFMSDIILLLSAWFTLTLVQRDIKFLIATEKIATIIHCNVRELTIREVLERMDDASR